MQFPLRSALTFLDRSGLLLTGGVRDGLFNSQEIFSEGNISACFRRRFMRAKRDRTISDVLPFGRLCYGEANAVSYAKVSQPFN
jgi:hypothetical protein